MLDNCGANNNEHQIPDNTERHSISIKICCCYGREETDISRVERDGKTPGLWPVGSGGKKGLKGRFVYG